MSDRLISVYNGFYKQCNSDSKRIFYSFKDRIKKLIGRPVNYKIVRPFERMILNDIDFFLKGGEVVGILGTSGSGKSTLMKLLSGKLQKGQGTIEKSNRILSLENVHGQIDLSKSGRENIHHFSKNLGGDKTEIERKSKEIIDFSELRRVIDMPIYSYSLSMRKQFEIAILLHSNLDVFLIDEYSGSNNFNFENQVLRRILGLKRKGKGIILTHLNYSAMKKICDRGVILNNAKIEFEGDFFTCLNRFENDLRQEEVSKIRKSEMKYFTNKSHKENSQLIDIELIDLGIFDINTSKSDSNGTHNHLNFFCDLKFNTNFKELVFSIEIFDELYKSVLKFTSSNDKELIEEYLNSNNSEFRLTLQLPEHNLVPGIYYLGVKVWNKETEKFFSKKWPKMPFFIYLNDSTSLINCEAELETNWMFNPINLDTNSKEVFSDIQPGDITIDCGANVGEVTFLMAERGAIVYAFEPNPYAFEVLKKRFEGNENVILINKGVWHKPGVLPLYLHENNDDNPEKHSVSSSILENKKNIDKSNYVEIELIDLVLFIEELQKDIVLVKLDVEGAEVDILNKLIYSKSIRKIKKLLVETHEKQMPELFKPTQELKRKIRELDLKNINLNWV
jgi:FkbM family methyltransferase